MLSALFGVCVAIKNTTRSVRGKKTGFIKKKRRHEMRLTAASVRRAAERDAYARLRHAHFFGVTYRLAPHDKPPKVVGDATVQIVSSRDTDRSALSAILYLIDQSLWSRPPGRCLARDAEFGAEQRPGAHDARRDVEHAADSKGRLGVADGLQPHAV